MWRPGNAALSRLEKHNRVARPTESARRPGRKFSRGGGLELQSGYALPPFQAAAFPRLILIDAESQVDCRAAAIPRIAVGQMEAQPVAVEFFGSLDVGGKEDDMAHAEGARTLVIERPGRVDPPPLGAGVERGRLD